MKRCLIPAFLAVFFVAAVSTTSCKKESSPAVSPKLEKILMGLSFDDLPSVSGGMLVFRDTAHFNDYLTFLNDAIEKNVNDSVDEHDVLFEIEDGMGFNSLRNITHTAFETQDALGWSNLDDIPDEHYIRSSD